jgi:cytochrome c oxidase assembly protein subunit 15
MLAYLLLVLVFVFTLKAIKIKSSAFYFKIRWLPLGIVLIQVVLGVIAVLGSIKIVPNQWGLFEWIALAHQFTAMLLLLSLICMAFIFKTR